jgi:peptidoglycan/LPS O-acetylase OafA/YrhL
LDHIDAMRPLKQVGVVSTHALLAFAPGASLAVGGSLMLLHVTREAFLFVSSCMLTYSYRALAASALGRFFWRRFVAVGIPYLCWTAIYFGITYRAGRGWGGELGHLGYLVGTGYYQLYYLLVIMEFYLVFPVLLAVLRRTARHGRILAVSALAQVVLVSLMHWNVLPPQMRGFWATRELTSYEFYLIAGMVVALHLDEVHRWLCDHVRLLLGVTLAGAVVAEVWFVLAARGVLGWLGSSSDPFQPVVIPFNVGAIASIYILGVVLVDRRRSATLRAVVRSGSDNSYGVYLAQMVFILALGGLGWGHVTTVVPWPILSVLTVALVFGACVLLTSVLARTALSKPLTGRARVPWASWLPAAARRRRAETPGETAVAPPLAGPIGS